MLKTFALVVSALIAGVAAANPQANLLRELEPDVVAEKQDGGYFTGLPALAYSPDLGFIYGFLLFHFNNGSRDGELFKYQPYERKLSILAVNSTRGFSQVKAEGDWPLFRGSVYRLKLSLDRTRNISAQYYGIGEATLEDREYPEFLAQQLERPESFDDYQSELQKKRGAVTWFRFDNYLETSLNFAASVERPVRSKDFKVGLGLAISDYDIEDYTGEEVTALDGDDEKEATQQLTRLAQDDQTGGVPGIEGGLVNWLTVSASYDSRDFEPDPRRGFVFRVSADTSASWVGSDYDFAKYRIDTRAYDTFFEDYTLAGRAYYEWSDGEVPFYLLPSVGGRETLKGYRNGRFRGRAAALLNAELRWRAIKLGGGKQNFAFLPILFRDTGRVFDDKWGVSSEQWRSGTGVGLRVVWNQATVIAFEYSLAGDSQSLYVNINHIF